MVLVSEELRPNEVDRTCDNTGRDMHRGTG